MKETSASIGEFCDATFGKVASRQRALTSALKELAELQDAYDLDEPDTRLLEECADVAICLMRFAHEVGGDLYDAIDAKMAINRKRTWKLDGTGNAQHVKADVATEWLNLKPGERAQIARMAGYCSTSIIGTREHWYELPESVRSELLDVWAKWKEKQ